MARDDETGNQIDEVELSDLGRGLVEIAEDLQAAGAQLQGRSLLDANVSYTRHGQDDMTELQIESENARTRAAFHDTLKALRNFRREYNRLERLSAEYALTRLGYSQRDAAQTMGVAASTINRWAQHPLQIEDYS
jgi:GrpB-like predicted nucleotidyltransferase (UPF0157 family)